MSKPTTLRLPDELLADVDKRARRKGLERAAYLRLLIKRGLVEDEREAVLAEYAAGKLSEGQVCEELGVSPWEFPDLLKRAGIVRNVDFEDWLDSAGFKL